MKKIAINGLIALALIVTFSSCEKDKIKPEQKVISTEDSIYWFTDTLMKTWYYWNEELHSVEYLSYETPNDLLEDLKVEQDKWSFIDKKETIEALFQAGESYGFGFYISQDRYYNVRVIFSFHRSEAYQKGVRRGWLVNKINGVEVNQTTWNQFYSSEPEELRFEFIDNDGRTQEFTLTKETFTENAVFNTRVFSAGESKVGYFAYLSFLGYSETELEDAVSYLNSQDIDELIIDLRYNGGGYIALAEKMADILVPSENIGKTFFASKHNDIVKSEHDQTTAFKYNELNMGLQRVFFLTNNYSASASELVINGLEPYMDVIQIGDATTGKPYGMYGFEFQDWLLYPVTVKSVNANGFGEYENGLTPDKYVEDNHRYDWGDTNDPLIEQAINYISYGGFGTVSVDYEATYKSTQIEEHTLRPSLLIMDR